VQKFPLIDLHRHLDGNIRLDTILDLAQQHSLHIPAYDKENLAKYVYIEDKTTDLLAFLQKLDIGISVIASLDDCKRIAYENVVDAVFEGLDHIELRFSPYYMAQAHGLPIDGVVEAVVAGVNSANKEHNYNAKLIGILSRTYGVNACHLELQALLGTSSPTLVGLDLAGDERNYPANLFVKHFSKARDAGLQITVHAGEADGPNSIWDAINLLGANRIGHGVAAIEDSKLVEYMAKHNIGMETCILSNYQTGTWTNISTHPVRQFLEQGVPVCLNTDDPGVSNNSLQSEYALAQHKIKLSTKQIQTMKINSLNQTFLTQAEKNAIKESL
jgi:adenosine deaminase